MCCDNKCLFFIKVRTGSLIFGYIGAVISGFGVLGCTGGILYLLTALLMNNCYYENMNYCNGRRLSNIESFIFVAILFIEFTAAFTCNVLLLFGITENKPALVKTYVIYGMIHLVQLLAVVIVLFCTCLPVFGVLAFLACGIYTLLIYMVYLTYKGMDNTERNVFANPPNLLMA